MVTYVVLRGLLSNSLKNGLVAEMLNGETIKSTAVRIVQDNKIDGPAQFEVFTVHTDESRKALKSIFTPNNSTPSNQFCGMIYYNGAPN